MDDRFDERAAGMERIDDREEQWTGGVAADEVRVRPAVEVADPDAEHVRPDDADRPGIAKSVRRAGLPGYGDPARELRGRRVFGWPRIRAQHVEDREARLRAEQAHSVVERLTGVRSEASLDAAVREHRVEPGDLFHRQLDAAEREREAVEIG